MKKLKNLFWITFGVAVIFYAIFKMAINSFTDHFLGDHPVRINAVIINKKNYMGNQPVKPEFSYSYQFEVHGHKNVGNAHNNSLQVGDTVIVVYNSEHPSINKPLNSKD